MNEREQVINALQPALPELSASEIASKIERPKDSNT